MELTEFEKKLKFLLSAFQHVDSSSDDVINGVIQDYAKDLLDLARKEVLKDLPKWKYMRNGACGGGDRDCFLIRTCEGYYHTSPCIGPDTTYLELDKLEKLPKEN